MGQQREDTTKVDISVQIGSVKHVQASKKSSLTMTLDDVRTGRTSINVFGSQAQSQPKAPPPPPPALKPSYIGGGASSSRTNQARGDGIAELLLQRESLVAQSSYMDIAVGGTTGASAETLAAQSSYMDIVAGGTVAAQSSYMDIVAGGTTGAGADADENQDGYLAVGVTRTRSASDELETMPDLRPLSRKPTLPTKPQDLAGTQPTPPINPFQAELDAEARGAHTHGGADALPTPPPPGKPALPDKPDGLAASLSPSKDNTLGDPKTPDQSSRVGQTVATPASLPALNRRTRNQSTAAPKDKPALADKPQNLQFRVGLKKTPAPLATPPPHPNANANAPAPSASSAVSPLKAMLQARRQAKALKDKIAKMKEDIASDA